MDRRIVAWQTMPSCVENAFLVARAPDAAVCLHAVLTIIGTTARRVIVFHPTDSACVSADERHFLRVLDAAAFHGDPAAALDMLTAWVPPAAARHVVSSGRQLSYSIALGLEAAGRPDGAVATGKRAPDLFTMAAGTTSVH
jgi:hypothetical protein